MKTIFLNLLLFTIVFASCSQKENQKTEANEIVGKWISFEYCEGGSGSPEFFNCNPINESDKTQFTFASEGTFFINHNLNNNCTAGTYHVTGNKIYLVFGETSCNNETGNFIYQYEIDSSGALILSPSIENILCDEGCSWKYKRAGEN